MTTIRDVMNECKSVRRSIRLFGATYPWRDRFDALVSKVGKAIASDISHSQEIVDLSPDIELGPRGELAYFELQMFLKKNQLTMPKHPL